MTVGWFVFILFVFLSGLGFWLLGITIGLSKLIIQNIAKCWWVVLVILFIIPLIIKLLFS